jgi:CRP-like cAMP-binding protein
MEARVVHPYSVMNAHTHGFAPVGFLPSKLSFGSVREHTAIMARYFGDGLGLRRNHPRIIPEAYRLAATAMENIGVGVDAIVDEQAAPYPHGDQFEVQELTEAGYSNLLRIERGRLQNREVFGPLRLHYGFFKLTATRSNYLIAREGGRIAGAIGFMHDEREGGLRVFELIHMSDTVVRFLIQELERMCRERHDIYTIEIDVSAHAPRMQRTLLELGFLPAAYVPGLAFHRVERMDVVKMFRLLQDVRLEQPVLPAPTVEVAEIVLESFAQQSVLPRIGEHVESSAVFSGLNDEQRRRVAGTFDYRTFESAAFVFDKGSESDEMYVVLSGRISVERDGRHVGYVGRGECLGEIALMSDRVHSAAARVVEAAEAGVMTRAALRDLVRRRPDIGVVLYRNLARELGDKLVRTDRTRARDAPGPATGRA